MATIYAKNKITGEFEKVGPAVASLVDITLTASGIPADAKVTGDAINSLQSNIDQVSDLVGETPVAGQIAAAIVNMEAEIDNKLNAKADAEHSHDEEYYTKAAVDSVLHQKANAEHDHSASEITYDNTVTSIGVTNVQDAIDFLAHNAGAQGGTVLYSEEQNLTDAQKAQALANIGVEIATDDEIIDLLVEADTIMAVADADGSILSDEADNILIW